MPIGSLESYQNTNSWSSFRHISEKYYNTLIKSTLLSRGLSQVHVHIELKQLASSFNWGETAKLSSEEENLKLIDYATSNNSVDLYFTTPKKTGTYILENNRGRELLKIKSFHYHLI